MQLKSTPADLTGKLSHLARTVKALTAMPAKNNTGTYIEIGANKGRSMSAIISHILPTCSHLHAIGYDLFEMATQETHLQEENGKGTGNLEHCRNILSFFQSAHVNLTFELFAGLTTDTLTVQTADWVYIDGGHSYETVKFDHQRLQNSRVIVFDDADLKGVNQYLWEIQHQYKLYDLVPLKGARQVAIVNDIDNYDFESAQLQPFNGQHPDSWEKTR
jgi:hypothetical protein